MFHDVALFQPRTGQYLVQLSSPGLHGAQLDLYISEGVPHALHILTQPSEITNNVGPLQSQPVLELMDAAGNPIPVLQGDAVAVMARFQPSSNMSGGNEEVWENPCSVCGVAWGVVEDGHKRAGASNGKCHLCVYCMCVVRV